MIVSFIAVLLAVPAQAQAPPPARIVSVVSERDGQDVILRLSFDSEVATYSAVRQGEEIVVRVAALPAEAVALPAPLPPVQSYSLGTDPVFSLGVKVDPSWTHTMVRQGTGFLVRLTPATPPRSETREKEATQSPAATVRDVETLYRQLFPGLEPGSDPGRPAELRGNEDWYSDLRWLGFQMRPWVSLSYVDAETKLKLSGEKTTDQYLVIQPNLGLGLSPSVLPREGRLHVNYSPRFRRLVDLDLPHLTSHFVDAGIEQPFGSGGGGSFRANYSWSRGLLETTEVDPGREYGIGRNRVVDTSLERFERHSFGAGIRFDLTPDFTGDINFQQAEVDFGVDKDARPPADERAFFDYTTRGLSATLRRRAGESRFLGVLFSLTDVPKETERPQAVGRGYRYGLTFEGPLTSLTNLRLMGGYQTQKNPNAGAGGRDYKDITYGAQLIREFSESTTMGLAADRRLYVSAFADNGFYIADSVRADLNMHVPLSIALRFSGALQWNDYRTSPQAVETSTTPLLREDRLTMWSISASRSVTERAYLRVDYTVEDRTSNLRRFDIRAHALTFQLGVGVFGKAAATGGPSW